MLDDFRKKVNTGAQSSFKEVENKYQIITSGLLRGQLCSQCVLNISNAERRKSTSREREPVRNP